MDDMTGLGNRPWPDLRGSVSDRPRGSENGADRRQDSTDRAAASAARRPSSGWAATSDVLLVPGNVIATARFPHNERGRLDAHGRP